MTSEKTISSLKTRAGGKCPLLIGRYRAVRQLGQGGMGTVWLGEDKVLDNRAVAIKMLPSILVSNQQAFLQVKGEALVSLKLSHPNIVTVRAFEENNGNPFIVMDYVEGQTLGDYLAAKGRLSETETLKLLAPLAAALDYAHTQGVVHRDVTPANILIRKDGTPFILDFGVAREIRERMTDGTGKFAGGTLRYMSPEQLNGAPPAPAQDVYSFSAVVYECLKGEAPFCRGDAEYQIRNRPPDSLPGQISVAARVMAGLAKVPESRPATCADVLQVEHDLASRFWGKGGRLLLALALLGGVGYWLACDWLIRKEAGRGGKTETPPPIQVVTNVVSGAPHAPTSSSAPVATNAAPVGVRPPVPPPGSATTNDKPPDDLAQKFPLSAKMVEGVIPYDTDYNELFQRSFRKAATGDADAQFCVGWMYKKGLGVGADAVRAKKFFEKSARQGNGYAKKEVGIEGSSSGLKPLK